MEILSNPGFPIIISNRGYNESLKHWTLNIYINDINNIHYINYLPIYITSLIRITQNIDIDATQKKNVRKNL